MRSKALFIDTNIFLHYQSFDEIDWLCLLDADRVKIYIASIVIQELDKHKYSSSKKLREKANKVIRKLHKLADIGLEANLKPNIDIHFEVSSGSPDFKNLNLDSNSQDDRLLASILLFRDDNPSLSIILVAADLGLHLKAKYHQIETICLPDSLKLHSELDKTEERIKELEKEVLELQRRVPELRLCFADNSNRFNYEVRELLPPNLDLDQIIKKCIAKLKEESPKLPEVQTDCQLSTSPDRSIDEVYGSDKSEVLPSEILRYNKQLEDFYEEYSQFIIDHTNYLDICSRTFSLEISIFNFGTCPAEDIDISMHFPDGFTFCKVSDLPKDPEKPKPPPYPAPKTRKDRLILMTPTVALSKIPQITVPSITRNMTPPNVSSPNIRRSNSYDVSVRVRRLKQNTSESISPMIIVFDSLDQVSSFQIDYKLIAENLPKPVTGQLHVIFDRVTDS